MAETEFPISDYDQYLLNQALDQQIIPGGVPNVPMLPPQEVLMGAQRQQTLPSPQRPSNFREGVTNFVQQAILNPLQYGLYMKESPRRRAQRISADYQQAQINDIARRQQRRNNLIFDLSQDIKPSERGVLQNLSLDELEDLATRRVKTVNPYGSNADMKGVLAQRNILTGELNMLAPPTESQRDIFAAGGIEKLQEREAAGVTATENARALAQRKSIQPKAYEEYLAKLFTEATEAGRAARSQLAEVNLMADLLKRGAETGFGEATKNQLRSVFDSLGFEIDVNALQTGEGLTAFSNRLALTVRNPAGGAGMPGAMSDADRQFLVSTVPGLARTEAGNALLIAVMQKQLERKIEISRMAVEYFQKNNSMAGFEDLIAEFAEKKENRMFEEIEEEAQKLFAANQEAQANRPNRGVPQPADED